jgi:penicillin-binding protein 1C
MPMNFNNHFNGPVRLRVALASSLNIPAVYTLDRIGINTFIERLKQLGFKSFSGDHDYFGLGIALGGVDVSLLELSNAYCSFADRGQYAEPVYFSNSGIPKKTKVMDELCVSVIQDILVDPVSRITGFGYFTTAARIKKAMIKTGTSNQFNNIWAVGTTPEYVVGVWMGNFTGDTIIGMPGSSLPARAVADFLMNMDLEKEFTPDPGLQKYEICSFSGQRKGPYCPDGIIEYFQPGIIPDECGFHKADRIVYPAEYAAWLQRASLSAQTGKAIQSGVHILTPIADAVFYIDPFQHNEVQQIAVEITAGTEDPVRLYYDGILLGEENYYLRHMLQLEKGKHTLVAESANKRDEVSFTVH